ncbi:hypothetical protein PIROE2DRAFT_17300 [Piromyces sp. E2]|nr:hypothetical protein PIROE2DRAFT_17300 [Piromyces sp. E2]|eukprot:OUM57650.1 hypothetical protein PIROE2DRAFT_17300 [Piromyces sp. E2]
MSNILQYNFFSVYVIIFFILFSKDITAKKEEINILIKEPDVIKYTAEKYSQTINDFINSNYGSQNFEIKFSFCETKKSYINLFYSYHYDEKYIDYLSCAIEGLKEKTYDMVLLDDRHLFTEVSLIENVLLEIFLGFRELHREYEALNSYKLDFSHHNINVVNDGYMGGNIYGIPYELDFDVIYSQGTFNRSNDLSWSGLYREAQATNTGLYSRPINIPIEDNDELLNFFTEYINEQYPVLEQKKRKINSYFDVFYNEKSSDLFNSFRDYVLSTTNITETVSMEQAIHSFIDNKTMFLKGRASLYSYLKSQSNQIVSILLPPKNYSAIIEKFLIINTHSKINKKMLVNVANILTSKTLQKFRADNFGSIPTFNVTLKETDPIIKDYCDQHPEICYLLEKIKPIQLRNFFKKDELSASFLEVRMHLPNLLKDFLNDNKVEKVQTAFKNIVEYRNHSQLKDLSPIFCNLIVFGFILAYFFPISLIQNRYIGKCKVIFYYTNVCIYSILLPMFMITFRVYYIYTHRTSVSFACMVCMYALIGRRLIYVISHPDDEESFESVNITNFISLNKEEKKFYSKVKKINHCKSKQKRITQDEADFISSNPNNIFFNRSLRMFNQQGEKINVREKEIR